MKSNRLQLHTSVALFSLSCLAGCGGNSDQQKSASETAYRAAPSAVKTAVFNGKRSDFLVTATAKSFEVQNKLSHVLVSVPLDYDELMFSDMHVNLHMALKVAQLPEADVNSLIELYVAFFNRLPDADGLAYWIDQVKAGQSLEQISRSFYAAALMFPKETGYSATMTEDEFVRMIYKNVLGRSGELAPPAEDVAYWVNNLKTGTSKGRLIQIMLVSARSLEKDVKWGWVTSLLNNKVSMGRYFAIEEGLNFNTQEDSISKTIAIASLITDKDVAAAKKAVGLVEVGNLPAVSSNPPIDGSLRDCFSADRFAAGNTYEEVFTVKPTQGVSYQVIDQYKVTGALKFNDKDTIEVVRDRLSYNSGPNANTDHMKAYFLFSDLDYQYFGYAWRPSWGVQPSEKFSTLSPAQVISMRMKVGESFEQSGTDKHETIPKSSTEPVPTFYTAKLNMSYAAREKITVGAGSFDACRLHSVNSMDGNVVSTDDTWYVAGGKFQGFTLRIIAYSKDSSILVTEEATKFTLNGESQ